MALPGVKDYQFSQVKHGGTYWYVAWQFWDHDRAGHVSVKSCACDSKWGVRVAKRYRTKAKAQRHMRHHLVPGIFTIERP